MLNTMVEHTPVLLEEAIELLKVTPGGTYVDCTAGLGGHAGQILLRLEGRGRLLALDRDRTALDQARERLAAPAAPVEFYHENFKNLPLVLRHLEVERIDGCLIDLGVSSLQLLTPQRGFSFREEGPLDMRMDTEQPTTAARLVNELPEEKLVDIFRRYGEEPAARKVAAAIVSRRRQAKFRTTRELAELVESVKGRPRFGIHPATQVFQALRIAVNQEIEGLEAFLSQLVSLLAPGGRLVVISFHSLEDRIVKTVFKREAGKCVCFRPAPVCTCPRLERVRLLTPRPVRPGAAEISANARARSAKLRAVERLANTGGSVSNGPSGEVAESAGE